MKALLPDLLKELGEAFFAGLLYIFTAEVIVLTIMSFTN